MAKRARSAQSDAPGLQSREVEAAEQAAEDICDNEIIEVVVDKDMHECALNAFMVVKFSGHITSKGEVKRICHKGLITRDGRALAHKATLFEGDVIRLETRKQEAPATLMAAGEADEVLRARVGPDFNGQMLKKFLRVKAVQALPTAPARSQAVKDRRLLVNSEVKPLCHRLSAGDWVILRRPPVDSGQKAHAHPHIPDLPAYDASASPDQQLAAYQRQLDMKAAFLAELCSPAVPPAVPLAVHASPLVGFRQRVEFAVWKDAGKISYVVFDESTKARRHISTYPQASRPINRMMTAVLSLLQDEAGARQAVLLTRLYEIDFLCTLSTGQAVITLIYRRSMEPGWEAEGRWLAARLNALLCGGDGGDGGDGSDGSDGGDGGLQRIHVVGRSKGVKVCAEQDYVQDALQVPGVQGRALISRQVAGAFSQPNGAVCEKMLGWALEATRPAPGAPLSNLLELYCGNGNFSIAIAANFGRVLATELSEAAVSCAEYNITANAVGNMQVLRASAEQVARCLAPTSSDRCNRSTPPAVMQLQALLRGEGTGAGGTDYETVLVDPPRAGLEAEALQLVALFPRILYISCNPVTAMDNLATLTLTHDVQRFALFDQFPFTQHIECGFYLVRRP